MVSKSLTENLNELLDVIEEETPSPPIKSSPLKIINKIEIIDPNVSENPKIINEVNEVNEENKEENASKDNVQNLEPYVRPPFIDDDTIRQDYEDTREMIKRLMKKGEEALDNLLEVAKESEIARDYEVAANLLKTVSDISHGLIDAQEKQLRILNKPKNNGKNETTTPTNQPGNIHVKNAVFVGDPKELIKIIREQRKKLEQQENG